MMTNELFDLSAEYESMLNEGLKYSGESMLYFLDGRLARLRACVGAVPREARILDFGCGIGVGSRALASLFPGATVLGADTSEKALAHAASLSASPRVSYLTVGDLASRPVECDLCYVNGVFHHIAPGARKQALLLIGTCLRPGGHLFFFENNPWNPGARLVMARIPFDRDAQPLSIPTAKRLVRDAGFELQKTETLFFFPRILAAFRPFERFLGEHTWLGAQYMIWSTRGAK